MTPVAQTSGTAVTVDGNVVDAAPHASLLDAVRRAGVSLPARTSEGAAEFIWNASCPLLDLVEVDGQLTPVRALAARPAKHGTVVLTRSERIDQAVRARVQRLENRGECALVAEVQGFVAAEAAAAGLVDLEARARWEYPLRSTPPSLLHDPNACIRCQACVQRCNDVQGVGALSFDEEDGVVLDEEKCVRCGQCIHVCPLGRTAAVSLFAEWMGCQRCPYARPLGAMRENDQTRDVWALLRDPQAFVVVQIAPAIRATLGEEYGLEPGALVTGQIYAALRRAGFDRVWDTNFSADLTIMEEGHELIRRIQSGGVLPQITSCSPGWIRFVETFYPSLLPNISSAKSPQQMLGAMAKTYAAQQLNVDPRTMAVVSVMPCTAKKTEAARPEFADAWEYWRGQGRVAEEEHFPDVDIVLTERELAKLLKMAKVDLTTLPAEEADEPLGQYTGAAPIFGRTGGVMVAALRTAYEVLTGEPLPDLELASLGTQEGIKSAVLPVGDLRVKVAVAHGLANARAVCESVAQGGEYADYHFIEIMACPGGCAGGGGQPVPTMVQEVRQRSAALNEDDARCAQRASHQNAAVRRAYEEFLGAPLSDVAHHLLHTTYTDRSAT
ncbi:MAG: 4Fe-4S binding protein [Actinobacteria bacterium]|nr:4Fe-4S binding protein [Actinomycetota bacterium]